MYSLYSWLQNRIISYGFLILLVNKKNIALSKTIKNMTTSIIMCNCNALLNTPQKIRPLSHLPFCRKRINTILSVSVYRWVMIPTCIVFIKYEGNTIWIKREFDLLISVNLTPETVLIWWQMALNKAAIHYYILCTYLYMTFMFVCLFSQ